MNKKLFYVIMLGVSLLFAGCEHHNDMQNPTIAPPVNEGKLEDWEDRFISNDNSDPIKTTNVAGHEAVDLGLPSGTLWATCNVGAEKTENIGTLFESDSITFDWGEGWHLPTTRRCTRVVILQRIVIFLFVEWMGRIFA